MVPLRILTNVDPRHPDMLVIKIQAGKARGPERVVEWVHHMDFADWWCNGSAIVEEAIALSLGCVKPVEWINQLDSLMVRLYGEMQEGVDWPGPGR